VASATMRHDTPQSAEKQGFGAREAILVGEGVVTAAGIGLGVAFLLQANSESDHVAALQRQLPGKSSCSNPPSDVAACGELRQAVIDRSDDRVFAITGFVIAGVGAASLVTTWLAWPSARAKDSAHVEIIPLLGGAVVRGAF